MNESLSQSEFYILLSLAIKSRHGYEIMKQVEVDSRGKVLLGPGTLYGSIKRMLKSQLIEEIDGDNVRRKYYSLTEKGRNALTFELERYDDALQLARNKKLFDSIDTDSAAYGI